MDYEKIWKAFELTMKTGVPLILTPEEAEAVYVYVGVLLDRMSHTFVCPNCAMELTLVSEEQHHGNIVRCPECGCSCTPKEIVLNQKIAALTREVQHVRKDA